MAQALQVKLARGYRTLRRTVRDEVSNQTHVRFTPKSGHVRAASGVG